MVAATCCLLVDATVTQSRDRSHLFTEAGRATGLVFTHLNGASDVKHLAETMGSGGLFFDYDNDGWIDLYITTAGGPNVLYRNRGDGTFEDITDRAGVGSRLWGTSCGFADFDGNGFLDLFVVNYVDGREADPPYCGNARLQLRQYCHPLIYDPLPNVLYRNNGDGTFTDVSGPSGVGAFRGNGLGLAIADFDDDGRPDVFVANDTLPNFLFFNQGTWRFTEGALLAGVAVAPDGRPRAGMGTDAADYDGDGRMDIVVTNHEFETHGLYRNLGGRLFAYATVESGIGPPTMPFVGFGTAFLDFDNDGYLDLAIVNGHVTDNIAQFRSGGLHAQRSLLFRNTDGRRLVEVGQSSGPGFAIERVGRGLAYGDINNNGRLDLLITNNGGAAHLLLNDGPARPSLTVRLVGRETNRDGIGARIRVTSGGRTQVREVKSGSSYLAQNDLRVLFGLGNAERVDRLEVLWPQGRADSFDNIPAGQIVTIEQGRGIVERIPYAP